jgi:Zn-dependent alcohol dehydrogenase
MRAAVLESQQTDLKVEEIRVPEPKAGEVLVNG